MREVQDKHIVVIGAARSGVAVACLLHRKGAEVFVSDYSPIAESAKNRLNKEGVAFEEGGHSEKALQGEFVVLSPGVPTSAPPVQQYLNAGKKVYSEIEAASWFNKSPIVAVTGSNGKTTVTSWLGHTWDKAEKAHQVGGNIGYAFSDMVQESAATKDALLEVSSFQLDHIDEFHPRVSMILNITPDHLDRYDYDLQKYAQSKFRITENQTDDDWFIYYYDDPIIKKHVQDLKKKTMHPGCWPSQIRRKYRPEHLSATRISS